MQVNGIIAEYNPFHNGHRYHLEESLRRTGADFTIVAMSGNFVQRGAPALADKHMRTEAALHCGADLVLELPALYAASSAEYFAQGAVALLDRLGVVTHLCFGSECGDTGLLCQAALILKEESPEYQSALKGFLKQGLSFPAARIRALLQYAPWLEQYQEELSSPNNILGLDYIRALLGRRSAITPIAIKRTGSDYHDLSPAQFCSALAIRKMLQKGLPSIRLDPYMPPEADRLLRTYLAENGFLQSDDFSAVLYYKLLMEKESGYEKYLDMTADLSNRIRNRLDKFNGFEAFCGLLKTKDMTYARISRCLLHILLGIENEHMALGKMLDYAPYARVLGFRKTAVPLLGAIKANSDIPLVTKLADAEKSLGADACRILGLDILTSELYQGIAAMKCGRHAPNEHSAPLIIL